MLTDKQLKKIDEMSTACYLMYKELNAEEGNASKAFAQLLYHAMSALDNIEMIYETLPF